MVRSNSLTSSIVMSGLERDQFEMVNGGIGEEILFFNPLQIISEKYWNCSFP